MTIIRIIRIGPNLRIIRIKTIMRIMRICANTANDDANKNKLKTQNTSQKSKLDIGCPKDIRCPKYSLIKKQNETILSIVLSLRVPKFRNEAIPIVLPRHCECRCFGTKQSPSFRHVIARSGATKQSL